MIYTSHYMEEIEAIADRVLILDHGQVLREGALNELLAEGAVALSLSAENIAPAALRELLAGFGTVEAADASASTLRVRLTARPADVFAALEAAGATVRHAELGRYNLEQLFMALTQRSLRD